MYRLGVLFILLSVTCFITGCSSTTSKQPYENSEFGITLEKPGNWDLEFYERSGTIVLEAESGFWNKDSTRIEIYGYACVSTSNNPITLLEANIDRIQILYDLESVTIVQQPTIVESGKYEVAKTIILIPTTSLPEDSARNQVGVQDSNIYQIIEMFAIRDSNNNSILVDIYKGNNEELNAEAEDIVSSIDLNCTANPHK